MPSKKFVTAWAATQSQMLRVRIINQVTAENQTSTAKISVGGCVSIGIAVASAVLAVFISIATAIDGYRLAGRLNAARALTELDDEQKALPGPTEDGE